MAKISKVDIGIQKLKEAVISGKWDLKDGYISEKQLIEFLGLSKVSVRRCIAELQSDNYLRSIPYKGYLLGPAAIQKKYDEMRQRGLKKRIIFVEDMDKITNFHHKIILDAAKIEAERFGYDFYTYDLDRGNLFTEVTKDPSVLTAVALMKSDLEYIEPLLQCCSPAVMVEYLKEGVSLDSVVQDDRGGINQAVEYLWNHNHKRIGLAVWGKNYFQPVRRYAAFSAALLRKDIIDPKLVGTSLRFDAEGGRECVRKLFQTNDKPTAIIISHLEMAAGVFEELEKMGLTPGKNVSVVAWGTEVVKQQYLTRTKWENMPLDLIQWSRAEMGKMVVRMIEARIIDPGIPPMRVEIPTEIMIKGSVVRI